MEKPPKGYLCLQNPIFNKGITFTEEEREKKELLGLLPYATLSLETEEERAYLHFSSKEGDLAKSLFLHQLRNQNQSLFYRLLRSHLREMVPLVYTPTVGTISENYSLFYTEERGLYLSYPHRDHLPEILSHFSSDEIDVAVVTDGERILGLGDLGIGGMAISVGKLALYTVFGGIEPRKTLPIVLDVGTNNQALLQNPLYLGWRHPRLSGKEYDHFIEQVISALSARFPRLLLQWEDFGRNNAFTLLNRYRDRICSFNDDIQGTAAVTLAAVYSALRVIKGSLKDQRVVFLGAGSAGIGIAKQLLAAMVEEGDIRENEAISSFYFVDREGLIHDGVEGGLTKFDLGQQFFAQKREHLQDWKVENKARISLMEVVENARPTILIGVSTQGGAFTKELICAMHKTAKRPIIFPLSNPTSCAEAHPQDLLEWTQGQALIATGTPFSSVTFKGEKVEITQCNNVYIFPAVGLALIATKAKKASDRVFITAAKKLSEYSPILKNPRAPLFPSLEDLPQVAKEIAIDVAQVIIEENNHRVTSFSSVEEIIEANLWF